jgi:hypothetical protein
MPNGSGGISAVYLLDSSAAANCRVGRISVDATQFQIASGILGAAGYVPMTFGVAGIEAMRIHGSGQLLIAQTTPALARCRARRERHHPMHQPGRLLGASQRCQLRGREQHADGDRLHDRGVRHEQLVRHRDGSLHAARRQVRCSRAHAWRPVSVDQGAIVVSIYKNGALERSGNVATMSGAGATGSCVTCIVNANGTDFYQLYVTQVTGAPLLMDGAAPNTWFQGYRIG